MWIGTDGESFSPWKLGIPQIISNNVFKRQLKYHSWIQATWWDNIIEISFLISPERQNPPISTSKTSLQKNLSCSYSVFISSTHTMNLKFIRIWLVLTIFWCIHYFKHFFCMLQPCILRLWQDKVLCPGCLVSRICLCQADLHLVYCYFLPTLTDTQKRNQESDKRSKICATILSHHHRVHLSKVQFNFDFDCGQMRFK